MRTPFKQFFIYFSASLMAVSPLVMAEDNPLERIIVFGDSLADGGYYSALLPLPPGTSFTTNPDPVAPEVFASQLGLSLLPNYGEGGTNYATGGARASQPNAPSIPITTQIDNFFAAGGQFTENDLIYIQGGGNDFFAFVAGGASDLSILTDAAEDLAAQVARVQAAGANQIVTMAVQSGGNAGIQFFNDAYDAELVARGINALYFDADALFNEMVQFADQFGFTNIVDPACGAVSSLNCTPADWATPDANETYILADDVHPGGKAQRLQGQAIASLLIAPEQIGQLSYAGQALFRGHRQLSKTALGDGFNQQEGESTFFGKLGFHQFTNDRALQTTGVEEDNLLLSLGLDHRVKNEASVGVAISLSDGEGDFDYNRGDYNVDGFSAMLYAQGNVGPVHLHTDFMLGRAKYESLTREVILDSVTRRHSGDTEANFLGLGVMSSVDFAVGGGVFLVPRMGLTYQTTRVDAYSEDDSLSTGAGFSKQTLDSLNGVLGVSLKNAISSTLHFYLDSQFNYEINDDDRSIIITPNGAPISYKSDVYKADREYISVDLGVGIRLTPAILLQTGFSGTTGRDEMDQRLFFVGTSMQL